MSSKKEQESFKNIVNKMYDEVDEHNRDKKEMLKYYMDNRLNASLKNYYATLQDSYNALIYKNSLKILKKLSRG